MVMCGHLIQAQKPISIDSLCTMYLEDTLISKLCLQYNTDNKRYNDSDKARMAQEADSIGYLYLNSAKYIRATHLYNIATKTWRDSSKDKELSSSLIHLGRAHYRQGNIFESFQFLNEGLLIAQEYELDELEGLGHLYLSWNYWRIRQCDEALNQLLNLKIMIDSNLIALEQIGNYYNARAKFEFCLGNMKESFIMADSAISFARFHNLRRLESVAMSNKVNYLYSNGTFEERFDLVTKAIEINKELGDKEQLGSNLGLLGNVYWKAGKFEESLEVGLRSLKITTEINDKPRIHDAHNICRRAYVGMKDYSNAYFHERGARETADEIYGLRHIDRIFDLQKAKDKAEQDQKLIQIANEKELERLKIAQERRLYAIVLGTLVMLLIGGIYSWFSYKRNKEKETQLIKEVLQSEMKELELQSLRALMNPHFIFNSLNSIKGFIIRNEPEVAANYLNKFSHLIRLILSNSQKPLISLADEVKALEMYIQLEGLRLEGKFEYSIHIEEDIKTESIQVAPMIIQPFVENAIWHGLMSKVGPKILDINIISKSEGIEIVIRDNGIGRMASQNKRQNFGFKKKSYGMKITENRIKFAQDQNNVIVKDLVNNVNEPLGTEVVIQLNSIKHEEEV